MVDCTKGAFVDGGSVCGFVVDGCFMFAFQVSNICIGFVKGAIGCFTCGNHQGATTVAFGAGSAFISGNQALCFLFIIFTTSFTAIGFHLAIAFASLYFNCADIVFQVALLVASRNTLLQTYHIILLPIHSCCPANSIDAHFLSIQDCGFCLVIVSSSICSNVL